MDPQPALAPSRSHPVKRLLPLGALALLLAAGVSATAGGQKDKDPPKDSRLTARDYEGYFPWTPPATKEAWEKRRRHVRHQILVGNGLWPLPEKTPLKPVI